MSTLLTVACPVCSAKPSERCTDRYGAARKVHDPRARLARGLSASGTGQQR